MAHIDALSRVVNLVEALPLEKELEYRQLQDPRLKFLARDLEFETHEKFNLIEGLVFRKGPDKPRFVIPESMVMNILRIYHDEMTHCGVEKTVLGISNNYWLPSMRKRVQNYVDNCLVCLMVNAYINFREGELQITESPMAPFMHADHFGLITVSADGFRHLFLIIDAFSRFTLLFPVKSTTSKETIKCLSILFQLVATPKTFITDRGTAFTSQEFARFMEQHKIVHRLVAVAALWANGLIERVNRFVKASFKKVVEDQETWSSHIK